jgi:hypothetical protein
VESPARSKKSQKFTWEVIVTSQVNGDCSMKTRRKVVFPSIGTITPPTGGHTFCRIKSDGVPGGEFTLEDSAGNQINLPITRIIWTQDVENLGHATLELSSVEIDAKFDSDDVEIILPNSKKRKSVNLVDFIRSHGKEEK